MTQKQAFKILKSGKNVFLTGPAGSGKTFLLNQYIAYLKKKKIGVGITASTGIAATHIGGRTIHSWCGIEIKESLTPKYIQKLQKRDYLKEQFKKVKVLIIDEVSMLHSYRLDMVDEVCRAFLNPFMAFGGLQVVFSGDFFQLPPVTKFGEAENFVYAARAWREMELSICYLEEQYRQEDEALLKILNAIRQNKVDREIKQQVYTRVKAAREEAAKPIKLFTHRKSADDINDYELSRIKENPHEFSMTAEGEPHLIEELRKSCLAPERLELKIGARVMFVKNKYQKERAVYINGTLGTVVDFDESNGNAPLVETDKGDFINVEKEDWTIDDEDSILAKVSQIPLRLAWAITVHKSQGMSLSAAEMDLRSCFTYGMGYVALSRVRTLDGLHLLGINEKAFQVHPEIVEFDQKLRELSKGCLE